MNKTGLIAMTVFSLMLGIALGVLFAQASKTTAEIPFTTSGREMMSPYDHVKENQIHVYENRVVLDIDAEWARLEDTNSMDPLFDEGANVLQIVPKNEEQIHVGDVISYRSDEGVIIHRVIKIGEDSEGTFYTVKGDNNKNPDDVKVRFDDVTKVLIGIIY